MISFDTIKINLSKLCGAFLFSFFFLDNLEVTGVSRSGRVRKKSSKLMDFRSPEDIDAARALKRAQTTKSPQSKGSALHQQYQYNLSTVNSPQSSHLLPPSISSSSLADIINSSPPPTLNIKQENDLQISDVDLDISQSIEDNLVPDDIDDSDFELTIDTNVRKSVYMTEKTSKKQMLKDGKVVLGRPQRKDKGKSRFTAYMLWSKEVRQAMHVANPDLDFATLSRRLGEMWANVPSSEKYNWRRKAKRMAVKPPKKSTKLSAKGSSDPYNDLLSSQKAPASKFLNKNSTPKAGKRPVGRPSAESLRKLKQERKSSITQTPKAEKSLALNDAGSPNNSNKSKNSVIKTSPTIVAAPRITSVGPADVAAHLKLLGDSLTIIGQRLKEHEVKMKLNVIIFKIRIVLINTKVYSINLANKNIDM